MNRRKLIGAIFGALLLAGLIFGMSTYAAERHSEQTAQAVASKARTANAATLTASNNGDKKGQTYTDTKIAGLSGDLAASVETSEVVSQNVWSKNALAVTDSTGTTYLFSVNSPDSPSAAMFRVPVSINGNLTVSSITSGSIDMSSGMLTVNSIQGSGFLLGNDGSASLASVKTTANVAVGKDLSVQGKTAVDGDFYAGANGDGTYGLQYDYAPGDSVRSLTLDGPLSATEIRIGTATKLNKDSFSTDTITANVALISKGTLSVAGASTLGATTVNSLTDKGSLTVKGKSTFADVTAGNVSAGNMSGTNIASSGALQVAGASTLASTSVTSLTDSGTLTVKGDSTLAKLTAGNTTVKSLTDNGSLTVKGVSNLTTVTATGKLTVNNDAKVTGDLTVSGTLHATDISGDTLTASILNGTTITAKGEISGTSLDANGGSITGGLLVLAGEITGATNINASGTITADILSANSLVVAGTSYGITSGGQVQVCSLVVAGTSYGIAENGAITGASLNVDGAITGTSLELSGDITKVDAITANSLNATTIKIAGGAMSVDANGNLTANSLTLTKGADTATIPYNKKTIAIPATLQGSIIVATPTSDPGSYWWIDEQNQLISLEASAPAGGVTFNCIAVNK